MGKRAELGYAHVVHMWCKHLMARTRKAPRSTRRSFGRLRTFRSGRWKAQLHRPRRRYFTRRRTPSPPRSTPRHGSPTAAARSTRNCGTRPRPPNPNTSPSAPTRPVGWLTARSPGRPHQGPHPRALPTRFSTTTSAHVRQRGSSPRSNPRTSAPGMRRPGRQADDAQSTPTRCCAPSWRSAVNDEIIDANPCRIVGAGRANRVHKIRPASVEEIAVLTDAMPEKLTADGHVGVVVCAAVRRDRRTTPRRYRPDPRT